MTLDSLLSDLKMLPVWWW